MDNNILAEPVHIIRALGSCLGTEMQGEFIVSTSNNLYKKIHKFQGSKGIDRTMEDKLMYISKDNTQNYPFC